MTLPARRNPQCNRAARGGKGDAEQDQALLLKLPRLFGSDVAQAEVLLRRALAAEPNNIAARCYLAKALRAKGMSSASKESPRC